MMRMLMLLLLGLCLCCGGALDAPLVEEAAWSEDDYVYPEEEWGHDSKPAGEGYYGSGAACELECIYGWCELGSGSITQSCRCAEGYGGESCTDCVEGFRRETCDDCLAGETSVDFQCVK